MATDKDGWTVRKKNGDARPNGGDSKPLPPKSQEQKPYSSNTFEEGIGHGILDMLHMSNREVNSAGNGLQNYADERDRASYGYPKPAPGKGDRQNVKGDPMDKMEMAAKKSKNVFKK